MTLVTLYDKKGEPFELTHTNAYDAETHLGWTRNPPAKPEVKAVAVAAPVEANAEDETPKRGRFSKTD